MSNLLPPEQQEELLPKLLELLENPFYKHFQQLWSNERDNAVTVIFAAQPKDLGSALLREQIVGEGRAFKKCAEVAQKTYENLVEIIQQKQSKP